MRFGELLSTKSLSELLSQRILTNFGSVGLSRLLRPSMIVTALRQVMPTPFYPLKIRILVAMGYFALAQQVAKVVNHPVHGNGSQ